ncbi:MAG: hypothetical protein AVDCRST_MAG26-73, partial [uncultured Chloroflexia bacterium]
CSMPRCCCRWQRRRNRRISFWGSFVRRSRSGAGLTARFGRFAPPPRLFGMWGG